MQRALPWRERRTTAPRLVRCARARVTPAHVARASVGARALDSQRRACAPWASLSAGAQSAGLTPAWP